MSRCKLLDLIDKSDIPCNHFQAGELKLKFHTEYGNTDKIGRLSLFCVNARSLRKNYSELYALITHLNYRFTLIVFTETWMVEGAETQFKLPGYELYSTCRDQYGGGLILYCDSRLKSKHISKLSVVTDSYESLLIEVNISKTETITIGAIYRRPSASLIDFVSNFKRNILEKLHCRNIILCGDFNIDLLSPTTGTTENFVTMMLERNLLPTIYNPTRVSSHTKSLIDHIWTSVPNLSLSATIECSTTDHFPICNIFNLNTEIHEKCIEFRPLTEYKVAAFLASLQNKCNEYRHIDNADPNYSMNKFVMEFSELVNIHFPRRKKVVKMKKLSCPWVSDELLLCIHKKHSIYRKYKMNLLPFSTFKIYRNMLTKALKIAKSLYYERKLSEADGPKSTWNLLNNLTKKTLERPVVSLNIDGEEITNNVIIAENLNNYFVNIAKDLQEGMQDELDQNLNMGQNINIQGSPNSIFLNPVTFDEVSIIIKTMKNNNFHKAEIPVKLLKQAVNIVSPVLSSLFNHCITTGIFPDILKIANITPVFKNGDRKSMKNYRPISILNPISKILEKLMYNRIYSFFSSNSLFTRTQFGFIKNKGIEDAALNLAYEFNETFRNKLYTIAVFIDFTKAFDMVHHTLLLRKCYRYGIRGIAYNLLSSYLTNRKQCVICDGQRSSFQSVEIGVPQGSSLGPLLFNIFINDVTTSINLSKIIIYADDIVLINTGEHKDDTENSINLDLAKLYDWSVDNGLIINRQKTKTMLITPRPRTDIRILLNNEHIELVRSFKYLGLYIEDNLKYKLHISQTLAKISRANGMLYSLKDFLAKPCLLKLYYSLIFPHINLHILLWGGANEATLKPLQIGLNNVVRNLDGSNVSTTEKYKTLRILSISQLYSLRLAEFMYQATNGNNRLLTDFLGDLALNHRYNTRRDIPFVLPFSRVAVNHEFFLTNAVKIWSFTPEVIKNSTSLHQFKKRFVKRVFIDL